MTAALFDGAGSLVWEGVLVANTLSVVAKGFEKEFVAVLKDVTGREEVDVTVLVL